MERVLCIKIASRGDLLLCAPAFHRLRASRPNSVIDLLVGESCRDVAEHLPFFDSTLVLDDAKLFAGSLADRIGATARISRILSGKDVASTNRGCYSEVLIFHRDWRYGALAWASGVRVRRGFYGGIGSAFLTHPYQAGEREHHVSQHLGMAGFVAINNPTEGRWTFDEHERDAALEAAAVLGFQPGEQPWVALGFGGGNNVKTQTTLKSWPIDSYKELANCLQRLGYRPVWVGDKTDAALLGTPPLGLNIAGKLTVAQTAAVLSACQLVIANDTLTLHLADSLRVPVIGLFGPTDPAHFAPRGPQSAVLWFGETLPCSPCHRDGYFPPCEFHHRCMTGLTVGVVLQKINAFAALDRYREPRIGGVVR